MAKRVTGNVLGGSYHIIVAFCDAVSNRPKYMLHHIYEKYPYANIYQDRAEKLDRKTQDACLGGASHHHGQSDMSPSSPE